MKFTPIIFAFVLLLQLHVQGQSNHITISGFTVKNQLPGNINDWPGILGSLSLIAQKSPQTPIYNPGLVIQLRGNSGFVCGNTVATAIRIDNFTVRNFNAAQLTGYLGQCPLLQPGTYSICVQFFDIDKVAVSREVCKEFTVTGETGICSPPVNISPVNGRIVSEKDISLPLTFTWSPVVPFDRNLVTYKLSVWEVEEGQTEAQAIYNNIPVLEQEIKSQTRYTVRPGFFEKRNAKYVWKVIALNEKGQPICRTAQSEYTVFSTEVIEKPNTLPLNTACGNGDFESGVLDAAEWSAGYTKISGNNSSFVPPFNNIMQPAAGNPVDAPLNTGCGNGALENHHVIVTAGADPTVPSLNRVPPSIIPNNYALRFGNNCAGFGTERITKRFIVTAADTVYRFMYALVFQAPHSATSNPSLWVRVFDATNTAVTGIVYLDPLSTAPMERAISDPSNPYWQSYNGILYRDWACAKINLSSLIGQTITIEVLTNDCAQGAHYGYGYFDNFCVGCNNNPPPADCCGDVIKEVSNNVTTVPGDVVNIIQQFNIAPVNIKYITAEIISVSEEPIDTSCMECNTKEAWAYQFISHNTTSWNSSTAMNATPVNNSSYYPAHMIEWNCNSQGNLKFNLKISLPGTTSGCVRKGKIQVRYRFTDTDCKTCERIVSYRFNAN
jgi:hypothetical protein